MWPSNTDCESACVYTIKRNMQMDISAVQSVNVIILCFDMSV